MKYFFCLVLLAMAISANAEKAYVDFNKFYFEGQGYDVFDVKGKSNTWYLEHRSLKITSESEQKSEEGENSASDDWIIFGPYDFTLAQEIEFSYLLNVNYGGNAVSCLASVDFPGYGNEFEMPGTWNVLKSTDDVNPEIDKDVNVSVSLNDYEGEKEVYLALRFERPVSAEVYRNQIKEIALTRETHEQLEEIVPSIDITRTKEGEDFFNVSGIPGDDSRWSVRTGYAKASRGNDAWLVMRPFNLTTSGDAFFSFESQLLSGTDGPEGLEIKIARERFTSESDVNKIEWEDYPKGRIDHRAYPSTYFESGKLDLSPYIGNWVTIAFRYVNPKGEQYNIKNFKMFHLPDVEPPVVITKDISRLVHNKLFLNLKVNEAASVNWGIYSSSAPAPTSEDIVNGENAFSFGQYDYAVANVDSTYSFSGLNADTSYKLYFVLKDINDNQSDIYDVAFSTPEEDLVPPGLVNAEFGDVNNFSAVFSFETTKPCIYHYIVQETSEEEPDVNQILSEGTEGAIEDEEHRLGFYNFEANTNYTLYWIGVDYADNVSNTLSYNVKTTNFDITAPVIDKFEVESVEDFTSYLTINADEAGTVYYVVLTNNENAPSSEMIIDGKTGQTNGSFNYELQNNDLSLEVSELIPNTHYIVYVTLVDEAGNASEVKLSEIKTTSNEVPVIEKKTNERINIDREATFSFDEAFVDIVNDVTDNGYSLVALDGENYTAKANSITAADNYTGGLTVPVCMENDKYKSNVVTFKFIVDYETVEDSLAGLRRNMAGMNLINEIEDIPTQHALLALQNNGSFFGGESPNSPTYTEYMNKVLGGRLINIAKDYYSERFRPRKATDVRNKLYKAIEYWIDNKPTYDPELTPLKWPEYMGAVMLSIYDDMMEEYQFTPSKREEISRLLEKIDKFNEWCWSGVDSLEVFQPYKGNNMSRRAWGTTALAAVAGNVELAFEVKDTIVANLELQYNGFNHHPAGLMPDGSYSMHNKSGSLWNWYPYGLEWISDVLEYAEVTRRTNWRLPKDKFNLLAMGIIDGLRWMHWNDFVPHNLTGMYYSDNGSKRFKDDLLELMNQVRYESFVNNADIDQNEEIYEEYEKVKERFSILDSTKYFWNSNALIHSRDNYIATMFIPSKRTGGFETGTDTIYGLKNYFLGDGAVFLYNEASSFNRRHLLDHTKLPGTTVERRNIILPYNFKGTNGRSDNKFAGGVSNGRDAISTFYYNRSDSRANARGLKSYFFFEKGYIALGNGINKINSNKVYNLATTIDQGIMERRISYSVEPGITETIEPSAVDKQYKYTLNNQSWFHFDNKTLYILPEKDNSVDLNVDIKERIEAWDLFNGEFRLHEEEDYEINYDAAMVATIEINHGKEVENAQYAYAVFAGLPQDEIETYLSNDPIKVLANNDSVQAVHFTEEKVFGFVFVEPGKFDLSDEITISVDKPATLLVKQNDDGIIEVWASDPYQREDIMELEIVYNEKNKLPVTTQRILVLPNGVNKGAPVYTNTGNIWDDTNNEKMVFSFLDFVEKKTPSFSTDVKELNEDIGFKIFPNPVATHQLLNLEFTVETPSDVTVRIVNASGQIVYTREYHSFSGLMKKQVECSAFNSGFYVAIVQTANRVDKASFLVR